MSKVTEIQPTKLQKYILKSLTKQRVKLWLDRMVTADRMVEYTKDQRWRNAMTRKCLEFEKNNF